MSILKNLTQSRTARVGVALGVVTATALSATQLSASAATQALKLSSATGPASNATKVLTVTGTGFKSAAGATLIDAVEFQSNTTCNAAKAGSNATAAAAKSVVSATSMAITTPSLATGASSAPKAYLVCVYTTTPALLGSATYTVYAAPTVTARSSTKGPSSGGQAVSIDGTNFTAKSTVTVGGVAATGVKFTSATALSFVTPKTTAGATNIVVTTEGGKSATGVNNAYTSLNAVVVSPKTGIVDGGDVITVTGAGFDSLDFTANAAVLFVPGVYAKAVHGSGGSAAAAVCGSVQVISDTELVCTTPDLGAAGTDDGSYIVTVLADGRAAATTPGASVVSSSATFTFADF
jgi:hypothetical protein